MSAEIPSYNILADPGWQDMPEPECILKLSWKDIVERAEQSGISLTRRQVLEIFETLVRRYRTEVISEDFWTAIDIQIDGASD